jgi:putative DNA primase/helicase
MPQLKRGECMKLTDILRRLEGVEEDHDGHLALCPAHNDRRHPSLKLTLKDDGQLLMVCRTGCSLDDVLEKINLPKSALFDVDGEGARTVSSAAPEAVGIAEIAGLRSFVDATTARLADDDDVAVRYLMDRFGVDPDVALDLVQGSTPYLSARDPATH